jgi:hypothetical protein
MLYCGLFSNPIMSLNYFAHQRSSNMFGVSSPAQRRYVHYAADIITRTKVVAMPSVRLIVTRVVMSNLPSMELLTGQSVDADLVVEIRNVTQGKTLVHTSRGMFVAGSSECVFCVNAIIQGDVQVDVYCSRPGILGGNKTQKLCFVQFHTSMLPNQSCFVFSKGDCDKVAFDKRFGASFQLSVWCETVEVGSACNTLGEEDFLESASHAVTRNDGGAIAFSPCEADQLLAKITEARGVLSSVNRTVEKAGYLCKMGLTVRSWQDRWFILRGNALSYYKSPKNAAPSGVIPLDSIWTVSLMRDKIVEPSQPYRHSLVLRTQERDFVLCANDLLELEEWNEALLMNLSNTV